MKKQGLGILVGFFVGLLTIFSINVHADPDYEITNYRVQANVQTDGSVILTQRIRYKFADSAHGVYYQQALGKQQEIEDVSVAVQQAGETRQIPLAYNGLDNTYQETEPGNKIKLKVFHSLDNQTATFIYRYKITDVVINWIDTAELNWKIIGSGWDVPLNNVKITIQLPRHPVDQLQAWVHADTDGHVDVDRAKGRVVITAKSNPENSFIESHLLFSPGVTFENELIKSEKRKKVVQKQEAALAKKSNQQKKRHILLQHLLFGGMFGLGCILFLLVSILILRNKYPQQAWPVSWRHAVHSFELPSLPVAVCQAILHNRKPDTKALSATLLELAVQRKIKIEELPGKTKFGKTKSDYRITLLDQQLLKSATIWRRLFNKVGDGESFTLTQLKQAGKKKTTSASLQKAFTSWQKKQKKLADSQKYLKEPIRFRDNLITILTILACGLLLAGSILLQQKLLIVAAGVLSLLIVGIVGFFLKKHSPYTASGLVLVNQLRGFKKMLADIGRFNLKEVGELVLWENVMPYAVVFGLAPKVAAAIETNFSVEELNNTFFLYYPISASGNNINFGANFAKSFSSSITSASANGSSGGFSGGSSGGFGGGSGGGAF
ncbi:hypothetical protein FC89_GL001745 [Liquorilactobacillus ghanensis DSM 18630]|uniref:Integral membrane protein n=1 Tax=Liquorilactobacillus ghanensis DSM 18630 TaxID=1423750 RepID=A0A0R1VIE0_9LACO|nr:DUF2207 domain-containing protein [Liquorilactobacillus ghanensis]KRM05274.1 hypothetical protein FC89_GL001745 [Liquorilactobacillus ghanensis DSM 18630]